MTADFPKMLNLSHLENAPVSESPFPYLNLLNFIREDFLTSIQQDYPKIKQAGSFPLSNLQCGPTFLQLIQELKSEALRNIIATKFDVDLTDRPVLITVRGKADRHDGKIHTDSKSKIISLLLYMNEDWQNDKGRLRLLYDNKNLEHYAAEIPPIAGSLLIFKVTPNGWHGHKTIIGDRKVIQLNYITNAEALSKHQTRHWFSATVKQLLGGLGVARRKTKSEQQYY